MNFEYNEIIKDINQGWLPFFKTFKKELEKIIIELNKYEDRVIYPQPKDIFKSLFYHPPSDIKICIIGQDPYIGEEDGIPQAVGLSFSVPATHKKIPPSLKNIFKEIKNCFPEYEIPKHGSLERWVTEEKMLLLNAALTVFAKESNSHSKLWTDFVNELIKWFSEKNPGCIFLLMGKFAQSKKIFIDEKHKIFNTIHPSPLSAHAGFFGCNVFKEINDCLDKPIHW
jgi:uracil-DNA glycosylase